MRDFFIDPQTKKLMCKGCTSRHPAWSDAKIYGKQDEDVYLVKCSRCGKQEFCTRVDLEVNGFKLPEEFQTG